MYGCDQCPYRTGKRRDLVIHLRTHNGESLTLRDIFQVLNLHRVTGDRPYKCSECPYAAAQSHQLTVHTRTHTGVKPFRCDRCPYASTTKAHLLRHMGSHPPAPLFYPLMQMRMPVGLGPLPMMPNFTRGMGAGASAVFACTRCGFLATSLVELNAHSLSCVMND